MAKRRSYNTIAQGAAIRLSDGQICPATPKILAQGTHMPYLGPLHLNGADALDWVRKGGGIGRRVVVGLGDVFDIRTATHEELLEFAENDCGVTLDGSMATEQLRQEVRRVYLEQQKQEKAAEAQKNGAARQAAHTQARQGGIEDEDDDPVIGGPVKAARVEDEAGNVIGSGDASGDPAVAAAAEEMVNRSAAKAMAANANAQARAQRARAREA